MRSMQSCDGNSRKRTAYGRRFATVLRAVAIFGIVAATADTGSAAAYDAVSARDNVAVTYDAAPPLVVAGSSFIDIHWSRSGYPPYDDGPIILTSKPYERSAVVHITQIVDGFEYAGHYAYRSSPDCVKIAPTAAPADFTVNAEHTGGCIITFTDSFGDFETIGVRVED